MSQGMRLKEERNRLGYTQLVFSELMGIAKSTLNTWEGGQQSPTAEHLGHMAALGVDVTYVVLGVVNDFELPTLLASAKKIDDAGRRVLFDFGMWMLHLEENSYPYREGDLPKLLTALRPESQRVAYDICERALTIQGGLHMPVKQMKKKDKVVPVSIKQTSTGKNAKNIGGISVKKGNVRF